MENELPMEAERNPEGFNFFKMQFFYLSLISLWLVFCINGCRSPNEKLFEVYEEYYPLKINKDSLFFKLEIWGISANHTRISLSTQKKDFNKHSKTSDYIYSGNLPILYKVIKEELHIYSFSLAEKPINFQSKVKVVQHKLNRVMMDNILKENDSIVIIDYPSKEKK